MCFSRGKAGVGGKRADAMFQERISATAHCRAVAG
jgi:hypothetical protein